MQSIIPKMVVLLWDSLKKKTHPLKLTFIEVSNKQQKELSQNKLRMRDLDYSERGLSARETRDPPRRPSRRRVSSLPLQATPPAFLV